MKGPRLRKRLNRLRWRYRLLTSRYRVLPDFVIIGAMRAGTSTLYRYLRYHPQTKGCPPDEVHFFDRVYDKGVNWYRAHFPFEFQLKGKNGEKIFITGEKTPRYLSDPYVPERVKKIIPEAKFIALLRNPIDRAYSHYQWSVRRGYETLSFEEALDVEEERLQELEERVKKEELWRQPGYRWFSYKTRGKYAEQLKNWFKYFPREQFLIIKSEDFYQNSREVFMQVLEFLGLEHWYPENIPPVKSPKYPPMSEKARKMLEEYFAPLNEEIERLLNIKFNW